MFWPIRARVTGTKSGKPTGNSGSEAIIQTTDATSGSRTVTCRLGMKKTEAQLQRRDLKDSQVDPPRDDKEKEFLLRGLLNQPFGEVTYDQGTQAWLPDLRVGNCNNIYS